MGFLDSLNPQQKEAVLHTDGPLLILAGAGSGKTRVIICRIAHLIRNHGVAPHAILAVTFTNKAAEEMRSRVAAILEETGAPLDSLPVVSTFHSFCGRLLRKRGAPLAEHRRGFTTSFAVYDERDQIAAVKAAYRQLGLDEKFMKARSVLSIISSGKNKGRTPEDFYREATSPESEKLAVIFERYQQLLLDSNALDFDDLLLEAVRLLRVSPEVRSWVNERFRYVMVDEYQDTNQSQYELMRLLVSEHKNICVVGDEDQSIYSWRGADIRNILDFEKDFPQAAVIRLERNYRSTRNILDAAGNVVAQNLQRKGKTLWTEDEAGEPIVFYRGYDGEAEALFVATYLDRYLKRNPLQQAAVLYRTNSQSRQMEEALRRVGRDYLVLGGVSFYQRAEVKDLLAYLRVALSRNDSVNLLRVINTPARGIGRTTVEQIEAFALEKKISLWDAIGEMLATKTFALRAQSVLTKFRQLIQEIAGKVSELPLDKALLWVYEQTGYKSMLQEDASVEAAGRQENIHELLNAAADAVNRGHDVHTFLDQAALVADTDQLDMRAKVLLMTLHSAKGLEFPLVAIIGLEEGLFPLARSIDDEQALEEERRLCYVGMTRARKQLLLSCARSRRRYGGSVPEAMKPSRFLNEVPAALLSNQSPASGGGFSEPARESEGVDLLVEQHEVRRAVESRLYGGQTYNSTDHIAEFFAKRGIPFNPEGAPRGTSAAPPPNAATSLPPQQAPPRGAGKPLSGARPAFTGRFRPGARVRHAKYGLGTVMRLEGEGDDQKLSVHFQRHGLRKLLAKYAALQPA